MYHRFDTTNASPVPPTGTSLPLHHFLGDHGSALRHAASLLAGHRGARLVDTIINRLADGDNISRATIRALTDLYAILTLAHVHDEDREEAALFAAIDPSLPIVEEICLLTDQFHDVLRPVLLEGAEALQDIPAG